MRQPVPATASTKRRVTVAVAESSCRKLSAVRSPVSTARAGPAISQIASPAAMRSPSLARQARRTCGSRRRKVSSAHGRPQSTASSRAMTAPRTRCAAGTRAAVTSPLPMSSRSAASTWAARSVGSSGTTALTPRATSVNERQAVTGRCHAHEHRDRQHEVDAGSHAGHLACARLLLVGGGDDTQDLLLIRPDQHPNVEQHDGAQPRARADDEKVVGRVIDARAEGEGADELPRAAEEPRAAQPGGHGSPAEPEQRPRGHILRDARPARPPLVGGGIRERRSLRHVEVVEQADPEHAGDDVKPARQTELVEAEPADRECEQQRDDDAEDQGLAVVVQWVHGLRSPSYCFRKAGWTLERLKNRRGTPIIQRTLSQLPLQPEERPPSPCINVCSLDTGGFCVGCLRTGDEIGRWLYMSAAEQWRLLDELAERRKLKR